MEGEKQTGKKWTLDLSQKHKMCVAFELNGDVVCDLSGGVSASTQLDGGTALVFLGKRPQ